MFQIIQSNTTRRLAERLAWYYKNDDRSLFDPFVVIVPAKVLEAWLIREVAHQVGVASLLTAKFWGQYQWQLIDQVLQFDAECLLAQGRGDERLAVPEQALLSASVIRWRLFEFLLQENVQQAAKDTSHPLYLLFDDDKDRKILWQTAGELARIYVGYLTERTDWLMTWSMGGRVDVAAMIAKKDDSLAYFGLEERSSDWQKKNYVALELALGYLWHTLFKKTYLHRVALEERFWQVLKSHPKAKNCLPKLYLFTVQQLPKIELDFLQQLSCYTDVILLHFNPSMMFWADIVDKSWLKSQQIIKPQSVYLKDHGHTLLSRLGKASRETFAMLAEMSGSAIADAFVVDWQDDFLVATDTTPTLLHALQSDILVLEETTLPTNEEPLGDDWLRQKTTKTRFLLKKDDTSLSIHNCHSLKRELEVARILIGQWLNAKQGRKLSDVAIMLPEVSEHQTLIRSVFGDGDGLDGLHLPASITGVADEAVNKLWLGITGVYRLPTGRFYYGQFCEWLMIEPVYHSFGLSFSMAQRACELLKLATFVGGLDERHLRQRLHPDDDDYQRTFAYALDRLVLSLAIDEPLSAMLYEDGRVTVMIPQVGDDDTPIIEALCRMYHAFDAVYDDVHKTKAIDLWLWQIEHQVIDRYFYAYKGTPVLNGIFDAINATKASLRANSLFDQSLNLPLLFVLDTLSDAIGRQQVSAKTSGDITIGRFGSLRGIDFGFVLMLGMDLHAFPRTLTASGFDLRLAGLPRRGDRVSEDDDNGAFLEALLQASDACAIFYSGQRPSGHTEGLPATPVAELIRFITCADCQDEMGNNLSLDDIEQHLITHHQPLPFAPDRFDHRLLLPPLWQQVADSLTINHHPNAVITLPDANTVMMLLEESDAQTLSNQLDIGQLAAALADPAKIYLKDKKPELIAIDDPSEPLLLDGLQNHKLAWHLQQDSPSELLRYGGYLPAGAAGETYLSRAMREHSRWLERLSTHFGQNITPCDTAIALIDVTVGNKIITLQCPLPQDDPDEWLSLQTTKTQGFDDKLFKAFLCHLCWQCHRQTQANDKTGASLWYYQLKDKVYPPSDGYLHRFEPIEACQARQWLERFLLFFACIKTWPIPISTNNALQLLKANLNQADDDLAWHNALKSHWLATKNYHSDYIAKDSHQHPNWQFILDSNDPLTFIKSLAPLARQVYEDFFVAINTNQAPNQGA